MLRLGLTVISSAKLSGDRSRLELVYYSFFDAADTAVTFFVFESTHPEKSALSQYLSASINSRSLLSQP